VPLRRTSIVPVYEFISSPFSMRELCHFLPSFLPPIFFILRFRPQKPSLYPLPPPVIALFFSCTALARFCPKPRRSLGFMRIGPQPLAFLLEFFAVECRCFRLSLAPGSRPLPPLLVPPSLFAPLRLGGIIDLISTSPIHGSGSPHRKVAFCPRFPFPLLSSSCPENSSNVPIYCVLQLERCPLPLVE